ncbi:MAG: hypothetical protein FJ104_07615, partial [Deltaproteobacteria bacterium]|nr:hypothetical protein [Deltaproteobacteria bacterium]
PRPHRPARHGDGSAGSLPARRSDGSRGLRGLTAALARLPAPLFLAAACASGGGGDGSTAREAGAGSGDAAAPTFASVCGAAARPATGELPCEVEAVLAARCRQCHRPEAELDACFEAEQCLRAPFPLARWADVEVALRDGRPIWEHMRDAVESEFMPLVVSRLEPPTTPLEPNERATLLAWLEACAPPVAAGCPRP